MGTPDYVTFALTRLLMAFNARQNSTYDPLFAAAGSNRPHMIVLEFRARVVTAVAALRAIEVPLQTALGLVHKEVEKIYREESLDLLLGDPTPTVGSIRNWYDDRKADTHFGWLCTALGNLVSPNLSPLERVTWLLEGIGVRCRYVGPLIRKKVS
jgi:hypothetical protein